MVKTYCNYTLYSEDGSCCVEEGDWFEKIVYFDKGVMKVGQDVFVDEIAENYIVIKDENDEETQINIRDIESFEV